MTRGFQLGHVGYKARLAHGLAVSRGRPRDRTYNSWASMIQRCTNARHPDFARYGGRGITVCDRWRGFKAFYADMGDRPAGMSIERQDNDKGYEPGNCRWATQRQQCRNQSRTVMVTIGDVTKPRVQWCEEYGIAESVVRRRVNHLNWTILTALITPIIKRST